MNREFFLATIFVAVGCVVAQAAEVSLTPSKDNTIFEDGDLSNGAGQYLFTGATASRNSNLVRRALMAFDVAGNVPAGATITDATLTLNMTKTISGGRDASLHRLLQDWGEGSSNASGNEGRGTSARTGDATWDDAFFGTSGWTSSGGDFVGMASDTISVGSRGKYTWGTGRGLNSDVQLWLDDPAMNFGWILIGDEPLSGSAKRFDSREARSESNRPTLTISFDVMSLAGDCNGDGVVDINDVECSCTSPDFTLPDALLAANLVHGDIDGDGSVAFADFLVLSANFGQDATYTTGDVDCNGSVAFADFLVLSANFGEASAGALASVPEPSACFGWFIGLLSLTHRRSLRTPNHRASCTRFC